MNSSSRNGVKFDLFFKLWKLIHHVLKINNNILRKIDKNNVTVALDKDMYIQ